VDLAVIAGSGQDGAITRADVEAAAVPSLAAGGDRTEATRRAIAAAMERSKREIPHYYLASWVDMRAAARWLDEANRHRPARERTVYSALVLRAVALAAREVPELNGYWEQGRFQPGDGVHVGMVVSLPQGGVLVPAVLDADRLPLEQLMPALRDLVRRARHGRLRGSELTSATITLTSLGEGGVEAVYGVIYPPQVALVGCGALLERPWAEDGAVDARPQICLTLSADHRASDGRAGARILRTVGELLQAPEEL
jgi:pyruvate dehydrogenase E2 component (dihydrolipoamide acetyltransferase)